MYLMRVLFLLLAPSGWTPCYREGSFEHVPCTECGYHDARQIVRCMNPAKDSRILRKILQAMIENQLKAIRQRVTVGMESRADVQALVDEAMRLRFGLG